MARDTGPSLTDRFSLDAVIIGLAMDLQQLRDGQITIADAQARANLAKQYFNGVRVVVNARKFLEGAARELPSEAGQ